MAGNQSLGKAKQAQQDEFYTRREDIEAELFHYRDHFKNKVVYCNCDDPLYSNFWQFFRMNFQSYRLRKLVATHYERDLNTYSYKLEIEPDSKGQFNIFNEPIKTAINCNGDFRSNECIELLKEADIVVTNPPFSLLREYIAQLIEYDKKFIIIANQNAITYKEIFPLIKDNKMWLGYYAGDMSFRVPSYYEPRATRFWVDETGQKWRSLGNACWFTNLDIQKRHEHLDLRGNYYKGNENKYPKYDNYNAIEVSRVSDIPCDYFGVIGAPITYLDVYCPEQFEVLDLSGINLGVECLKFYKDLEQSVNGEPFVRNMKSARFSPMISVEERPNKTCYRASNANGYLLKTYRRIFIRRKPNSPSH